MSLRAELLRLGLRWFLKSGNARLVTLTTRREHLGQFERWVPLPPSDVVVCRGELGGVATTRIETPASRPDRHILFLHGGGYVTGSAELYRHITWRIAGAAAARLAAIDYRLAPEHPFPAALDDAIAAWHGLIGAGAEPRHIALVGDSAGGGLAFALALRLRDEGLPLPVAIAAMSPWTDLALTGRSLRENSAADPMQNATDLPEITALYLAGADPRNPYASPLYGDPTGLPPSLIQVGSDEILRDDAVRLAERLPRATLEIWPRMPHVWHAFAPFVPEATRAIRRIGEFLREVI